MKKGTLLSRLPPEMVEISSVEDPVFVPRLIKWKCNECGNVWFQGAMWSDEGLEAQKMIDEDDYTHVGCGGQWEATKVE